MPDTDSPPTPSITANIRALLVDADELRRQMVAGHLEEQGVRVLGCSDVDLGRELFDDHALVVTPLNGDNQAVLEFVAWLRTRAGRVQPYVTGLGEYRAPASEWHGFNEFVSLPFEGPKVQSTVDAARRWHGWSVGVNLLIHSEGDLAETVAEQAETKPVAVAVAMPLVLAEVPLPTEPDPVETVDAADTEESTPSLELLDVAEIFSAETPPQEIPAPEIAPVSAAPAELSTASPPESFNWGTVSEELPLSPASGKLDIPELAEISSPVGDLLPRNLQLSMAPKAPPEMSVNLHQQITEASPFGLLLLDDDANLIYANPQHRNVLGLSVESAGGLQGWLEHGVVAEPGQHRATIEAWYEQVWRRRLPMVMTMRSAESLLKEIEFRPSALPEERLLIAVFDVTDARREDEAMRASEARFRNLFMHAPYGVIVVNAVGNVTDASIQFEQLVGCSRLDMRRLGLEQFFSEDDYQTLLKMAFSTRAGSVVAPFPITVLSRMGVSVALQCDLRIVKNSSGASVFTAYYFHPLPPAPMPAPVALPNRLLQAVSDLVLELNNTGKITAHLPTRDFAAILPPDGVVDGRLFAEAFPMLAVNIPLQEMIQSLEESLDAEVRCEFKYRPAADDSPRRCEARLLALAPESESQETRLGLTIRSLPEEANTEAAEATEVSDPVVSYEFSAITLLRQAAIITNEKGRICNVNPAAEALFGYAKAELLGHGLYKLFLPDQPKEFAQKISEHINRHRCWIGKSSCFHKDGSTGRVSVELVPFDDHGTKGFFGLMRDITTEEQGPPAEQKPSNALTPVPGGHDAVVSLHRARNDLQVLTSLLNLQASEAGLSPSVREALQESKDRVGVVALVYRLVDGDSGMVDFSRFAAELAVQVLRAHNITDGRVSIAPPPLPVKLKQKMALNLGLILQELLSTTVVHTFPGEARGTIEIRLELSRGSGVLSLKDNGPFHTVSAAADRTHGIGWKVVEALSQQIHGELKILSDLENEIRLSFKCNDSPAES
jgi:PAS domain S-box-containing protein